jgi:uncharacterized protein (TIGR03118 family)
MKTKIQKSLEAISGCLFTRNCKGGMIDKVKYNSRFTIRGFSIISLLILVLTQGCYEILDELPTSAPSKGIKGYKQVNLVSDTLGFDAKRIDVNLVNAWGIAFNPNGPVWINANGTGLSVIYDKDGNQKRLPVGLPFNGVSNGGTPSGIVFNKTQDFIVPNTNKPALFLFATEDGLIYAWNGGDTAIVVVDNSSTGAVYKGIEIAQGGSANFIFATDFHNGKVDAFDNNFKPVTWKKFADPNISEGFAPFNIHLIDNKLYVTYAKQLLPEKKDDEKGLGNGFVNVFDPNGMLIRRFASNGFLNSPWGIAKAPEGFGQGKDVILIGNFGDGRINVFDKYGKFLRQLKNEGKYITIDGLWSITFPENVLGTDPNLLYFAAGPNDESHGLFGYLEKVTK